MDFVDASSWWGSIKRTIYGEGRKSVILHIEKVIDDSIKMIEQYQDTIYAKIIINNLVRAKIGVANLAATYKDDPSIVAKISVCITNIEIQLNNNKHYLDEVSLYEMHMSPHSHPPSPPSSGGCCHHHYIRPSSFSSSHLSPCSLHLHSSLSSSSPPPPPLLSSPSPSTFHPLSSSPPLHYPE